MFSLPPRKLPEAESEKSKCSLPLSCTQAVPSERRDVCERRSMGGKLVELAGVEKVCSERQRAHAFLGLRLRQLSRRQRKHGSRFRRDRVHFPRSAFRLHERLGFSYRPQRRRQLSRRSSSVLPLF